MPGQMLPGVQMIELAKVLKFPPTSGTYMVLPISAVDGDTARFYWLYEGSARIYGINTPEINVPDSMRGEAAKQFLTGILPRTPVAARVMGPDKYGRTLLDILDVQGNSLGQRMIAAGHALAWDGKGAKPV